jgi:stage V sporulation protein B
VDKQSGAKGFTVLSVAGIINKVLGVLYVPVLMLILGNFGMGIYNAGYTIYLMVFVITNAGIPIAISKLVSEQIASSQNEASYRTLKVSGALLISIGVFTSILTAVFAKQFSALLHWPDSYLTVLALSPTMFFTAVSCTFRGYFQGRSNMVPTSVSQVIEQAVNSTLTILFAWALYRYGRDYAVLHGVTGEQNIYLEAVKFGAAGGTIGTSVGALASALYLCRKYLKSRSGILKELEEPVQSEQSRRYTTKRILKKIFQYSIPITLGSVAIYMTSLIDLSFTKTRLVAGGFSEIRATELYGIFSTQYLKVLFIPVTIATALATAIIPGISAAAAVGDGALLGKRISRSIKTILMISVPSAVGMAVLAKPIVRILFPKSPDGWDLLMLGSWTIILISLVSIQTAILQGIGKTYVPTVHLVIGLALKLFLNYNLVSIKAINMKGAIIGSAACYIFAAYMNYRSIKKYTGVQLSVKRLFNRPFSVSVIMGVLVLLIYEGFEFMTGFVIKSVFVQSVICGGLAIAAGGIVYYVLMILARGLTVDDIRSFPMGNRVLAATRKLPLVQKYLA